MRNGLSAKTVMRILGKAPMYTIAELEQKFPPRNLPDGAMVTRFAPSPTGFVHIGNVYGMLIDKKLAQSTGGIFYLRIEDTDTARTVDGGVEIINSVAERLGLSTDEGPIQGGPYGSYCQSERRDIYHSVAAELLSSGKAYPCFMTQSEMDSVREMQESAGIPTGIYGEYARDRNLTEDEITARLDAGEVPSVRWYSTGDEARKVFVKDVARGSVALPEWTRDEVLIKSNDKLPTYHFAHLCDDHFMRTTHVVRDESWLGTAALHVMLFAMMDWQAPLYYHTPTLDKIDAETGNRRKLSKRKDPEFSVANWWKEGWPAEAILEYLFNLIASGYEEEKLKKPDTTIWNYPIKLKKMPTSGALFDMKKLEWWAREFIATLPTDELVSRIVAWAKEYGTENQKRSLGTACGDGSEIRDQKYLHDILSIERDPSMPGYNPKRIRKDFITWSQTLEEVAYFFDEIFEKSEIRNAVSAPLAVTDHKRSLGTACGDGSEINKNALTEFLIGFDINDDKDAWWKKITDVAAKLEIKPGDVAMALRVALTGRTNTPDLFSIMQVMGDARVRRRISGII